MLAIGTSHGLVLGFDSAQTLRWCHRDIRHQGSISALCFNHDGTRILAGFAKGYILMIDSSNGKILRTLTDVHPPGTAVLHVKVLSQLKLNMIDRRQTLNCLFQSIANKMFSTVYRFSKTSSM